MNDLADVARHQAQLGNHRAAERSYRELISREPSITSHRCELASSLQALGRLVEAEHELTHVLRLNGFSDRAYNQLGIVLAATNRTGDAVHLFRRAVELNTQNISARSNLGNALRECGSLEEAKTQLERTIAIAPEFAIAHNNLGMCYAQLGRIDAAIQSLERAIDLQPGYADALAYLAGVHHRHGAYESSISCYQEAVKSDPHKQSVYLNLAEVFRDAEKLDKARSIYQRVFDLFGDSIDLHLGIASVEFLARRFDDAIHACRRALKIDSKCYQALSQLGIIYAESERLDDAVNCFRQALDANPQADDGYNNLGNALRDQHKTEEAIAQFRLACQLNPANVAAHNNLGIAYAELGRFDEAVECYHRALRLKPDYPEALSNLGITLTEKRDYFEALAAYDKALAMRDEYPDAKWNRSLIRLSLGNFEEGWPEYEYRWKRAGFQNRNYQEPEWDGALLDGCPILIYSEQGLGDTLQFMRYLQLVKERGGYVIFECPPSLVELLSSCKSIDRLVARGDELPPFATHCALMTLPLIFRTSVNSVPFSTIPYIHPCEERVQYWKTRLSNLDGLRIGIAWQGNPKYRGDRYRSIPLSRFAPLGRIEGINLISLQKGLGTEQIGEVSSFLDVMDLGSELDEKTGAFVDTAALMKSLDLVITSDTSMPHLAGAVGTKVWVALSYSCDWRWLLERTDCPWYSTMRLFRQREFNNWYDVFHDIVAEINELIES